MDVAVVGCRVLEEELRAKMEAQQARRNYLQAQMLRNEELLFEFESKTDHLLFRLCSITVPGQDDSLLSQGVEGKFQYLGEKLLYPQERAAHLPPERRILDESNETFVQARDFLEKKMSSDPRNVMVLFEDRDSSDDESSEDRDEEDGEAGERVPTREDIKREGQLLIETTELEAAESQTDHEAEISEKMEAAKAAVQCLRLWDDSLLSQGVEGKFQYLAEKLLYLQERAAHLPPERRILDESNESPAHEFSPDLGAVSKALSMGGAFRWGCGSMKAAGGVVSIEPQKEQEKMLWGKEGDPYLQNHLVVKNNQCAESSEDRDEEDGEAGEHVPTREDIKREGQLLIESKKGAMKK
ncbi:hypothetical protein Q9233_002897 [Columba guinea]|nr:hypothetical protein Q9233_002897 [Columba guinea]